MFLNFIGNLFPKKQHQQTKTFSLSVKTQKMSAIRDFSRGEREILRVCIEPDGN